MRILEISFVCIQKFEFQGLNKTKKTLLCIITNDESDKKTRTFHEPESFLTKSLKWLYRKTSTITL